MTQRANGKKIEFESEVPLPTRADYDKASPRGKGYLQYMWAEWPRSTIPKQCPFKVGTPEYAEYCRGQEAAMLDAQDSEE